MQWVSNPGGADRILYVASTNKGCMKVRATGLTGLLFRCLNLDPNGPIVRRSSLYPITRFGFRRTLGLFLDIERWARAEGDVDPQSPSANAVEIRHPDTGGPTVRLTRRLPAEKGYPAALTRAYIDMEYRVPTRMEAFDDEGQLIFRYILTNVRFNVGLTDDDFSPQANGLE